MTTSPDKRQFGNGYHFLGDRNIPNPDLEGANLVEVIYCAGYQGQGQTPCDHYIINDMYYDLKAFLTGGPFEGQRAHIVKTVPQCRFCKP